MVKLQSLVFVLLVGALALVPRQAPQAPASPDDEEVVLDAVIQPSQVVDVSAGVLTGLLESIDVDRGDTVQEGQLLATLDTRLDAANYKLAQARAELTSSLESSLAARNYYAGAYDRAQSLFEQQLISEELRDQAEEEAILAESRWRVEQESHTLYQLEVERNEVALEMRKITAPVSGVVTQRLVDPGEFVGQATLLTIAKLDPLYVEVVAPAALYGSIRIGTTGTVMPGEPIGGNYPARVTVVDQVLDAASNTFGVRLELANPDRALPAGLRAKVRLPLQPRRRP